MRVRFPLPAPLRRRRSTMGGWREKMVSRSVISAPGSPWLLLGFVFLALGAEFWVAPISPSPARDLAPGEMIQAGLPPQNTIGTARKGDLLFAICGAVKEYSGAASALTSTAVAARKELAGEIVGTVLRCSEKSDCEFVGTIVAAAVAASGQATGPAGEAALAHAPNCAERIRRATQSAASPTKGSGLSKAVPPTEQPPPAVTSTSPNENYDPLEPLRLVCGDGTQRALRQSNVDDFLQTHPGSFVGVCPPTPSPSASPPSKGHGARR